MPTIQEVAKIAGVSVATVSRVINGNTSVHAETVEHVTRVIAELDYKPNLTGRNLRRQETKRIVVLLPNVANPFFSYVVRGIEDTARKSGYNIMLCNTDLKNSLEMLNLELLDSQLADGAIFITSSEDALHYKGVASKQAIVHCCEYLEDTTLSSVTMDNFKAAFDATSFLISLGHREIGFFSVYNKYLTVKQRMNGLIVALENSGLPYDPNLCISYGPVQDEDLLEYMHSYALQYIKSVRLPSAVFCSSDLVAFALIRALKSVGIRVPEDISVMGFDDVDFAQLSDPGITTVHIPKYEIGQLATELLLAWLQDKHAATQRLIVPHSIIQRDSTAFI